MGLYRRYLLPRLIECACGSPTVESQRRELLPRARGEVLELGFGSGLNLPHYRRDQVSRLWALEPSQEMRALAAPRVAAAGLDLHWLDLPGEAVPLPDASVDCVVMTYTLCTIADTAAALAQVRRVLRPGGRLLFCEHGAAPDAAVRRWQNRLDRPWGRLAGGCHLNRDVVALIAASGFDVDDLQQAYLPRTPRFAGYNSRGCARPRAA